MKFVLKPDFRAMLKTDLTLNDPNSINMIHMGTPSFAREHGGALTAALVEELLANEKFLADKEALPEANVVIDTRINMLMTGMFPSIPGWHCDWVRRCEDTGQPLLDTIDLRCKSWLVLLADSDTNISGTEFLCSDLEVDIDPSHTVWSEVHKAVEPSHKRVKVPVARWIRFNSQAVHRATPALQNGWRFFFRASIVPVTPKNIIRRHVQTYTLTENCGW